MRLLIVVLLLAASGLATPEAHAQGSGTIPIEQDLRRWDRVERRIEEREGPQLSDPYAGPVNPGGVPGFYGPPGTVGDSVNSYDPLPQGITGSDIR